MRMLLDRPELADLVIADLARWEDWSVQDKLMAMQVQNLQLGQGRGGFYSYERLENLVGAGIHNSEVIVSEWQHLSVGDEVKLAPEVALRVARVDPERAVVLRGGVPMGKLAAPYDFTWAFVINEMSDGRTRGSSPYGAWPNTPKT